MHALLIPRKHTCRRTTHILLYTDPGKPLPVVEDAEAKVSFKFVFDFKMKVLVVVNNLFFQPS